MRNHTIALLTMLSATFAFAGPGQQDTTARLKAAGLVMHEIMAAPDKGVPAEVLHGARCIAVIPDMAKAAFLVGGEHGRGVVTCRTGHGWSAPAFISIGGGNFGFQAGGQAVDLVLLFMNDKGVQGLLSSKFELTGHWRPRVTFVGDGVNDALRSQQQLLADQWEPQEPLSRWKLRTSPSGRPANALLPPHMEMHLIAA